MALVIALVRLILSLVFGVAGISKLIDQQGTREAVMNFGAPKSAAPAVAVALPLVELAVAIGLLFSATAWWSALASLVVLGLFVVAISINLAQGKTHECHCFGQIYSRPLGWPTLARNVVFALAAGVVIWNGSEFQPGLVSTLARAVTDLNTWQLLLLIVAAVVPGGLYLRWRQREPNEQADTARPGLPIGSTAPAFDLPAYEGGRTSLSQLLALGKPVLLIFTNPKCGPCIAIFKEIKDWQTAHNDQLTITLLSMGTIKDNFVNVARNGLGQVLLQEKSEVSDLYRAYLTPTAVMVDPQGRIQTDVAAGADQIRALLKRYVPDADTSIEIVQGTTPPQASKHPTPVVQ